MRSRAEIVADVGDDGRPVLVRLRSEGALAARATGGPNGGEVHLVGTAAGPLGGDVVEVSVLVRAGARLRVAGVAATLALPGRSGAVAESRLDLVVEDGGSLEHELPPLVVCGRARLRTVTHLGLTGSGRAEVTELVVLGRYGEPGGDWTGRISAERSGLPVLRTTQRGSVLAAAPVPARVALTRLLTAGSGGASASGSHGGAVACPLATGDLLVTAIGPDIATVIRDAAAVLPPHRAGRR